MKLRTILALSWLLATGATATAQELTDRDLRAGQVIFDTIRNRTSVGEPSAEDVRMYKRECADDTGDSYCFSNSDVRDPETGETYSWNVRIQFWPEDWKPNPESAQRWATRFVRKDAATGGDYFYQRNEKHKKNATRVSMKVRRGRTQLVLQDTRFGGLDKEEHIRRAEKRWRFLVEDAERQELFFGEPEALELVIIARDPEGRQAHEEQRLRHGNVLSFDRDLSRSVDVTLDVGLVPFEPGRGEQQAIRLTLDEEGLRETQLFLSGLPLHAGPDGAFVLPVDAKSPEPRLVVRFKSYTAAAEQPIGQKAVLTFANPLVPEGVRITLHRATWFPVIRQFEVVQRRRANPSATDASADPGAQLDPMVDEGTRFNEYRIHAGRLYSAWKKLEPQVAIRPSHDRGASSERRLPGNTEPVYRPEERVILAWKLDRTTRTDFLTAENSPESPDTLTSWLVGAHNEVCIDLWIARDPAPRDESQPAPDDGFETGFGGGSTPPEPKLTPWQIEELQRELRRNIFVEEARIEVVRVSEEGGATADEVAALIRLPAGSVQFSRGNPEPTVTLDRFGGGQSIEQLGARLPYDHCSFEPKFQIREPGIYEARLFLTLRHRDGSDPKSTECAVRFRVVDQTFEPRELYYRSERLGTTRSGGN